MATQQQANLIDDLKATGAEVLDDAASLELFAHDIYARGSDLAAVVRPSDTANLADAVRAATAHGHAVVPRGGGMSYTGGYTPTMAGAVLFDTATMDRILEID